MKKYLLTLITLSLLLCEASFSGGGMAFADDSGTCGTNLTYTYTESNHKLTISGSGAMTDWAYTSDVPWNSYKTSITAISIGSNVTSIGKHAFNGCNNASLTSITIPSKVTSIGYRAFYGMKITSITIPENVEAVGDEMLNSCSALTSVTWNAKNCSKCKNSNNNLVDWGSGTNPFYTTPRSNVTSFTFGSKVEVIPQYICYNFTNASFTKVTLPASVKTIGAYAFSGCTKLTEFYVHPEASVTSYPEYMLNGCTALQRVNISKNVTSLGSSAFYNCSALQYIFVQTPSSAPSAGSNALYNVPTGTTEIQTITSATKTALQSTSPWSSISTIIWVGGYTISYDSKHTLTVLSRDDDKDTLYVSTEVKSGVSLSGNVSLPPQYTSSNGLYYGYIVKPISIVENGYKNQTGITSVTIGNSYGTIGASAFSGCTSLATVTVGTNVTSVPSTAFTSCPLSSVTWNAVNHPDFGSSSASPFYNRRTSITTFTISSSIKNIPAYLCYGMTGITGAKYFYSSLQSIGAYAFNGCTGLTSISFSSASNLTSIGGYAFSGCTGLTSLTSLGSATKLATIGTNAFYNCNKVTSSITLPASLTSMGTCAFQTCKEITGLTFANGFQLTSIPNYAFDGCAKLAGTITIPASITAIGNYAFRNCSTVVALNLMKATELTSIGTYAFQNMSSVDGLLYIPSKVTAIGNYALADMTSLDGIVARPNTPPTVPYAYTFNHVDKSIPVYVKDEDTKNLYKDPSCTGWKDFTNYKYETDPQQCGENLYWQFRFSTDRVVFTGNGDMWDYDNSSNKAPWRVYSDVLKYVDWCSDMTSVGNYAFYGCNNLVSITLRNGIKSVGEYAFYNCSNMNSFSFPGGGSLESIGQRAFYGCSSLKKISFPEGITTIPNYCFYNCTGITEITFPSTLTTVGNSTFQYCSALKGIILPSSVTLLDPYAFANCSAVEYIKSDNETPPTAYSSSFNSIDKATTLLCVPEGSEEAYCEANYWSAFCSNIGQEIGGNCSETVKWKYNTTTKTLTVYGSGAIPNYSTNTMPWNKINSDAQNIVIETGITSVGQWAFYGMPNVASISLPEGLTTIGNYGFSASGHNVMELVLPSTLSSIGINAFSGLSSLAKLTVLSSASTPATMTGSYNGSSYVYENFNSTAFNNAILVLPNASTPSNYLTANGWKNFVHHGGYCGAGEGGQNLSWTYNKSTHLLAIDGTGAMANFASSTSMPWNYFKANIMSIEIEDGVTTIGHYAFNNCTGLTSMNNIPNSVTTIGYSSFWSCSGLESFTFPVNITTVGDNMLNSCTNLTTIEWNARNCTGCYNTSGVITNFTSSSVNPFFGTPRTKITSFTFGEEVEVIPPYLCSNMNNEGFTSITIPASTTTIGANAFSGCTYLSSVTSNAATPPTIQSNTFSSPGSKKLITSCETRGAYEEASHWSSFGTFLPFRVNFDMQSHGSQISLQCVDEGDAASEPSDPTADYYTFDGWYENEGCTGSAYDFSTEVTADKILYAKWTANNYAITYKDQGNVAYSGSNAASLPATHTYDAATELVDGAKTGYTFDGWFANSDCTGDAITSLGATDYTDDITLYAKWTINQYTVSFDSDGGSEVTSISQDYNTEINAPANPTKTGYTFNGWIPAVPSTMPAENTECVAQWTINQYTVSFDSDGGSEVASITQDYNSAVAAPADPTKTGYTFAGWIPAVPSTMPAEDTECVAQWTINSYDVTFDLQGHGSAIDAQSVNYNGTVSQPSDPEADYYTFGGWYKEAGCSNAWDFGEDQVTDDLTLYAKWTLNGLALDEGANNAPLLEAYDGQTTNVTMTRSLTNAQYNTFCLPFSLSADQMAEAFGAGYDLEELTDVTYEGETLALEFTQREALEAGKPYLLQPTNNVANPSFSGVEISNAAPSDGLNNPYIEYRGVYSPASLEGGNHNLLFLGAGNELFWPASTGDLKGFRAYFIVKSPALGAMRARIVKKEDTATGIDHIQPSAFSSQKYIKDGILYIERDGKTFNAQGQRIK